MKKIILLITCLLITQISFAQSIRQSIPQEALESLSESERELFETVSFYFERMDNASDDERAGVIMEDVEYISNNYEEEDFQNWFFIGLFSAYSETLRLLGEKAVDALLEHAFYDPDLTDKDLGVFALAQDTLISIGGPAVPALIDQYHQHYDDIEIRMDVIYMLNRIATPEAKEAIKEEDIDAVYEHIDAR